jgi:hypothetical protein
VRVSVLFVLLLFVVVGCCVCVACVCCFGSAFCGRFVFFSARAAPNGRPEAPGRFASGVAKKNGARTGRNKKKEGDGEQRNYKQLKHMAAVC